MCITEEPIVNEPLEKSVFDEMVKEQQEKFGDPAFPDLLFPCERGFYYCPCRNKWNCSNCCIL